MQNRAILVCLVLAVSAGAEPVQSFLHGHRHGQCPYILPAETTLDEILSVKQRGYDTIGIGFGGPYNNGNIDWSALDAALAAVADATTHVVIAVTPRFFHTEGVHDTLNTGAVITHSFNQSPNYAMIDIFDAAQRAKFNDYLARAAARYGSDARVAAFTFGWGYLGETGFFHGDFASDSSALGAVCAGYSPHALQAFNAWRAERGLAPLAVLPLPRDDAQSDDYIAWMRFRSWYVGEVFQREAIDAMRAHTTKPLGTFGYLPASPNSYARNWSPTPNADFYRGAGSAGTFDLRRSLLDSAIGWEDSDLHAGGWDFSAACMRRDQVRQLARGAAFHGMWYRGYQTEPQWEADIYDKVSQFLLTQDVAARVRAATPTVALFQPTWSAAAVRGRSAPHPFLPRAETSLFVTRMIGVVESFGLPSATIWEQQLEDPALLDGYDWIVLPLSDLTARFLGAATAARLLADPRVIPLPERDGPLPRSVFRALLQERGIAPRLDYDDEAPLAGRIHNVVYNWRAQPLDVVIPHPASPRALRLGGHEVVFLPEESTLEAQ